MEKRSADRFLHSKYPTAEVLGIDLANIQPPKCVLLIPGSLRLLIFLRRIPPNLSFAQRDIESPWHGMDLDSWDLIHMRMLNGAIMNWPETYAKVFRCVELS
jgi:hypothetical protein